MFKTTHKIKTIFYVTTLMLSVLLSTNMAFAHDDDDHIISIGGSVTEIVFALGEEDRLIARDTTSVYPEAALKLPDVGYIRRLAPEGVLSAKPSMIITLEGAGPPEAVDVIKSSDIPFIEIAERYSKEGVISKILAIGNALGVEHKAQDLAVEVQT